MSYDISPIELYYNQNSNFAYEVQDDQQQQQQQVKKDESIVPNLLLSYVYFLNNSHTTYINVGFDINNFEATIVLYKNTKYLCFSFNDWINLYTNIFTINNFFQNKDENFDIVLPIYSDKTIFKLCNGCEFLSGSSNFQNNKYLVCENSATSSKIYLTEQEWNKNLELTSFLQSVITWYEMTSKEIKSYFEIYNEKCLKKGVTSLSSTEYFLPGGNSNTYTYFNCNYSRLFSEIPILCKKKIIKNISNYVL